ncbi:hypothetical protein F5880DRAFT_1511265, partial [Lentinula raphanica]
MIRRLKDEEVELGIAPYITSLNTIMMTSKGKNVKWNDQVVPGVYSAGESINNASGSRQLHRDDRRFKPYSNPRRDTSRPVSSFNPSLICENPYCIRKNTLSPESLETPPKSLGFPGFPEILKDFQRFSKQL